MKVLVIGANGQIGKQVVSLLAKNTEHEVRAMVRSSEQVGPLKELGAHETIVADLEKDVSVAVKGCDAVVFSAGSGGHTGADKTILVDFEGALKTIEAAEHEKVKRFLLVSAFNADNPENGREALLHYNVIKKRVDERLMNSSLNYTIIRPGRLKNEPGTGKVVAGTNLEYSDIPREDVAKTLVAALDLENLYYKTFKVLRGETPIEEELKKI
jgi:uncharacterized protein YbjT (DUF2867 family)